MKAWEKYNKTTRLIMPNENLVRFIQKTFPDFKKRKKIKILDAGFASGRHLVYLAKQGFDVCGFDNSKESLKFAKKWLKKEGLVVKVAKADMLKLPYKNNSFDVFIEIGTIEHLFLKDREKAIREAFRVLKPGGQLFLNVKKTGDYLEDSGKKLEEDTYLINESFIKNTPYHFFNKKELKGLFKNFRDLDLNYSILTRDNMSIEIHDWIVVAKK
jgi:ubiquinone/menaquinone biosynthesis C-methylase UbiE